MGTARRQLHISGIAPSPNPSGTSEGSVSISPRQISRYLESMQARGCVKGSIEKYARDLDALYQFLPDSKRITRATLADWRAALLERGYAPRSINAFISEANGFLAWLDLREYQLLGQLDTEGDVQPELTRNEYLRLLSAARTAGKERAYLLVKVFAAIGLAVQELPQLTAEALEENRICVTANGVRRIVRIPAPLRDELKRYVRRAGITGGPVFVTRTGKQLNRTSVTGAIQSLAHDARVPPEKCNPRCLRKLYQSTMAGIAASVSLLVEQTHERLLDQEQLTIGWPEVKDP